ncbi:MAG: hypothetical protein AAFO93_11250 [Pseudomonadota bacterium]
MIRFLAAPLCLLVLAACQPAVPDSGAGVGFGTREDFLREQARRDAALEGAQIPGGVVSGETVAALPAAPAVAAAPLDATGGAATGGTDVTALAEAALNDLDAPTATGTPADQSAISDEQSFDAVANRESIESDAARIAANRAQFEVIQPTALPTRSSSGPNVVEFALSTTNVVGQSLYRRSGLRGANATIRNCAAYTTADEAQADFLALGGPERDRRALDPDGDGFACGWNPAPYRLVRQ